MYGCVLFSDTECPERTRPGLSSCSAIPNSSARTPQHRVSECQRRKKAELSALTHIPLQRLALQMSLTQPNVQEIAMIRKNSRCRNARGIVRKYRDIGRAEIIVRVAPPQPRMEVAPQPRRGYVWVAGHWEWREPPASASMGSGKLGSRTPRPPLRQPTWVQRDGGWTCTQGGWRRGDADHDGVPNGQDRSPNNPNRS
jgi:hypothetical protein